MSTGCSIYNPEQENMLHHLTSLREKPARAVVIISMYNSAIYNNRTFHITEQAFLSFLFLGTPSLLVLFSSTRVTFFLLFLLVLFSSTRVTFFLLFLKLRRPFMLLDFFSVGSWLSGPCRLISESRTV